MLPHATKRGKALRGRADTLVMDLAGRAVGFTASEPKGLSLIWIAQTRAGLMLEQYCTPRQRT